MHIMYFHKNRPCCESSFPPFTNRITSPAAAILGKGFVMKQQVLIPSVMGSNLTGAFSWELKCSEVCRWHKPTLQVYFKLKIPIHAKVQGKLMRLSSNFIWLSFLHTAPNPIFSLQWIFNEMIKALILILFVLYIPMIMQW